MKTQDRTLHEIIKRVLSVGGPQKVILFGSRARGDAKPGSDYDLLVIESSDLPRYRRAAKYRKALTGVCLTKDIVVWTPEEVAEWQNVPNAFITTAINEGIVLYER
jgi:uncharacterized protein